MMAVSAFVTTKHVDDVVIRLPFVYNLEYNLFSVHEEIIGTQFVNRLYMRLRCLVAFSFPNINKHFNLRFIRYFENF